MRHGHTIILNSACSKLFNKKYDFTYEEISLFMSPYLGDQIQIDATISRRCIENHMELRRIIEKNTHQDLESHEMSLIFNYLSGAKELYKAEYLDLFHWFYFNWQSTRFSKPFETWKQSKKSLIRYHDYAVMAKNQKNLLSKITSWD